MVKSLSLFSAESSSRFLWKEARIYNEQEEEIMRGKVNDPFLLASKVEGEKEAVKNSVLGILDSAEKYEDIFDQLDKNGESPAQVLGTMLSDWEKGDEVDRAKFMAFIKRACEKGKMNGNPDSRIYYMIMGLGVKNPQGEVLLNESSAKEIQSHVGDLPLLEFFADKKSPKKDGKIVPSDTPGAEIRPWNSKDFIQWADQLKSDSSFIMSGESQNRMRDFTNMNIALSRQTQDRISKSVKIGSVKDFDDTFTYQAGYDPEDVKRELTLEQNNRLKNTDDFWLNWLIGSGQNLFARYDLLQKNDKKYGEQAGWKDERKSVLQDVVRYLKSIKTAIPKLSGQEKGNFQALGADAMESGGAYGAQAGKVSIKALEVALKAFEQGVDDEEVAAEKALSVFSEKVERGSDGYTFQVKNMESEEQKKARIKFDHDDAVRFGESVIKKPLKKNILGRIGEFFK